MSEELETGTESGGMDMDAAVSDIGSSLGFGDGEESGGEETTETTENSEISAESDAETVENTENNETVKSDETPTERSYPQSWAKDKAALWAKTPPDVQDQILFREKQMLDGLDQYKEHSNFGKQMRDVMTPYKAMLQAQGVDEPKAVQYLLNAHYRLSNGQPAEKQQYFANLAKSYGIDLAGLSQPQDEAQIDPTVKALQDKVNALESGLTAREQASLQETRAKVGMEVNTFASDPKNIYFDECADDIIKLIKTGESLETAYKKAVWANPVTREKELARISKENEAKLRVKAKETAEAARRATSSNLRTRDTTKAPTEPTGKLFGDMHDAEMREIVRKGSARAH